MPVSIALATVAMFTIFACALAWAQLQTRYLAPARAVSRPKRRPL